MPWEAALEDERTCIMLTGACLCGGVRYEIDGKIGPVGHCHCLTCRKAQGGAFVTNAPFARSISISSRVPTWLPTRALPRIFERWAANTQRSRR